jgi:ribosomal-protein-alanine N-acetyltransferase
MSVEPTSLYPLVRQFTMNDLDRVVEIEHEVYPFPWTRGIFSDCIRVGYDCWGLQLGYELVAYAVQTQSAGENHLLNLCVHPDWQRNGYGSLLLEHVIRRARSQACSSMFLEVRPSNIAGIGLYQKRGFQIVGERPDYYRAENGRENAVIMRFELRNSGVVGLEIVPQGDPF